MQLLTFISDVSQKYICLIPFAISCQQETKQTNKKTLQTKQEPLAMIHVCKIPTEWFFDFVLFKRLAFQTSNESIDTENPNTILTTAASVWQVPSFIPCLYSPFLSAKHPHLMNHYQSHLSRIQIPKIDANTVSSTLSLGILSKLWINWHTELALGRVTLAKSRPALILQSAQENITNILHRSSSNSARPISLGSDRATWLMRNSEGGDKQGNGAQEVKDKWRLPHHPLNKLRGEE